MVERYEIDYIVGNWLKIIERSTKEEGIEKSKFLEEDEVFGGSYFDSDELKASDKTLEMYDGYNHKHKLYKLLVLDNYGDDGIYSLEEYEKLKQKPPLEEVRLDVLFSAMLVDVNLNCCLVDIKKDLTYSLYEVENKMKVEIPFESMLEMFGGKRPYYYDKKENTVSLRFNPQYEEYLRGLGFEKEPGREKMLTKHRVIIG